jgi:hypothetical protein
MKGLKVDALCSDLSAVQWSNALRSQQNVDDMVSVFNSEFLAVWNKHAPVVSRRIRKRRTPWMSEDVITLAHKRDAAYKDFLHNRSDENYLAYKILRNAFTGAVRRAKREFFIRGARAGSRQFWRHVKQCTGLGKLKTASTPWPCYNATAAKMSANRVNNAFIDILHTLTGKHLPSTTRRKLTSARTDSQTPFSLRHMTSNEIRRTVDSLPANSSVGHDGISVEMLKKSPAAVYVALEIIFNASIDTGTFPSQWKEALITPIYKKGNIYDPANYRPIALLSIISKVLERLISVQLREYTKNASLINNAQHGFRQGRSCETALLRLSKLLFDNKRAKKFTYVVAIDFTRAFDTVNLEILQDVIASFANDVTVQWFGSYLLGRRQATRYSDAISEFVNTTTGVPQGSVLGPSLFSLYITSLLDSFTSGEVIAYADDLTLICSGSSPAEAAATAERLIAIVHQWSTINGLVLNALKCEAMFVSPFLRKEHQAAQQLAVGSSGTFVKCVDELRLLGVLVTHDLRWHAHASRTRKSINSMIGTINRFGNSLNMDTRQRIVNAFIIPKMTHAMPVWCWLNKTDEKDFDHTMLRCARVITHNRAIELNAMTHTLTGLLPFSQLSSLRCVKKIHQLLATELPTDYLPSLMAGHGRTTRNSSGRKFLLPAHNLSSDTACFSYDGAKIWNNLPFLITEFENFHAFTAHATKHVLSKV